MHHLFRFKAAAGQTRQKDVYVGVDCFGRGSFGGGGWNTYKVYFRMDEKKIFAQNFMMVDIYPTKIDVLLLFEHNSITVMSR